MGLVRSLAVKCKTYQSRMPGPIAVTQLPYLVSFDPFNERWLAMLRTDEIKTAVAKEALRISSLVRFRSAIRAPEDVLQYGPYSFPPGVSHGLLAHSKYQHDVDSSNKTTISMTPATALINPTIFEDPNTFIPERWLPESSSSEKLAAMESFFTPFGLGNRRCIGTNYAYAQTQTVLLVLFRRFNIELFDVVRERDIDHSRAWAVGEPSTSSPGMRVKVTPRSA